jgi:predicted secreted Zn-dependent protease
MSSPRTETVLWIAVWVALLFPSLLHAQSTLQVRTNYYRVTGNTLREIQQSLAQSRPRAGTGEHNAQTAWQITWQFNASAKEGTCHLTSFSTRTTIKVTLPLWATPTNAAPEVFKAWRDYYLALAQHEQGHVQLAKDATVEIQRRADTTAPRSDCGTLKSDINALCRGIVDAYRNQEKEYDERTRHGATQGAVLRRTRDSHDEADPSRSEKNTGTGQSQH